jgi:hypothetical protein
MLLEKKYVDCTGFATASTNKFELFLRKYNIEKQSLEVFTIALALFFLETLYFKTSLFILDYLNALLIISYALLGLGLGAIISHKIKSLTENMIIGLKLLIIVFIVLSFLNFVFFANYLFFSPALIIPFALGNIIIANYLKVDDARKIYFFDLAGATVGVLLPLFLIPIFREENCYMILIIILSLSAMTNKTSSKLADIAAPAFLVIFIALLFQNWFLDDWLNFIKITRCRPGMSQYKTFCWGDDIKLIYSKGSNVQRIDAFQLENIDELKNWYANTKWIWKNVGVTNKTVYVAFDGQFNDGINVGPFWVYAYDARIMSGLIDDPDFLLIGTSAQGVVKTAIAAYEFDLTKKLLKLSERMTTVPEEDEVTRTAIGEGFWELLKTRWYKPKHKGKITGIELNPEIIGLMKKPWTFWRWIYTNIDDLQTMNGRTYLDSIPKTKKFDIITLMNIHQINDVGLIGAPEGLHTYEAVNAMLDHLSERGFVVFEERLFNKQGELSSIKILNTFMQVLKDRGLEDPRKHIFFYRWSSPHLMPKMGGGEFAMIMIKKTPFTNKDWQQMNIWRTNVKKYMTDSVISIYPVNEDKTPYATQVNAVMNGNTNIAGADLSIITDDKPFPWSVYADNSLVKSPLLKIGLICLVMLLIISIYWLSTNAVVNKSDFALQSLYFSLIGLGYFIIEIGLINFYQILTGSPAYSFIFVMATLLISSGIGSYYSRNFTPKQTMLAFGGILVFCLYHLFFNRQLISSLNFGPLPLFYSILVGLTILPLGFCMGIPFPGMLQKIKAGISQEHIPYFFAANCLFSTFAVILSFYLSVTYGLKATFSIGIACYLLPLFFFIRRSYATEK